MQFPRQPHLLIYKRFGQLVHPSRVPFFIFGSGSDGNSVYIKPFNMLIDLGLAYYKYENLSPNFFSNVKYLVLTHIHSDHLKIYTLKRVLNEFPNVRIIMLPNMGKLVIDKYFTHYSNNILKHDERSLDYYRFRFMNALNVRNLVNFKGEPFEFIPRTTTHGKITNLAVEIRSRHYHFLYATDLDSVMPNSDMNATGLPMDYNDPFNVIMLEANYDENIVNPLLYGMHGHKPQLYARENRRHLSEQKSVRYANYMLSNHGIYVPLHSSDNFGSYSQNTSIDKG